MVQYNVFHQFLSDHIGGLKSIKIVESEVEKTVFFF